MENKPLIERQVNNGPQRVYKFDNGYGASVVCHPYSYGYKKGLQELAVIQFYGEGVDDWDICYTTPITDDVIGNLSEAAVQTLLEQIKALPAAIGVTEEEVQAMLKLISKED